MPCDEVCRNRAGRVSARCNFTKSSDRCATVQARRFAVRRVAINLPKGHLGLVSRIEKCGLFAVYSRPQNNLEYNIIYTSAWPAHQATHFLNCVYRGLVYSSKVQSIVVTPHRLVSEFGSDAPLVLAVVRRCSPVV